MSTRPTDTQDLSGVVESLRDQLNRCRGEGLNNRGRKSRTAPQLAVLEKQVTALLDLLDQRTVCDANTDVNNEADDDTDNHATCNLPAVAPHDAQGSLALDAQQPGTQLATDFIETLERSLAQWQAQIMLAYSQGAALELGEQLQSTIHLNEALQLREARLESQRQALEKLSTELLQQRARTQRQRRAISQMLRAQKAEMLGDIERRRHALQEQIQRQQLADRDQQSEASSQHSEEIAQLQLALQSANDGLANAQQEWQNALAESESSQLDSQGLRASLDDVHQELKQTHDELQTAQKNLQETSQLLQELEQNQPAQATHTAESEAALRCLSDLEQQLAAASQEIRDLKEQNFDLASQVAKHQVVSSGHVPHVSFDSSTLSWEERKKLIMRQLEEDSQDDDNDSGSQPTARRMEIENVVRATQAEIERRDAEIAELQAIIEQQSDTRQGVAIGAAAFAQAFDSDEIIQQERQKLKEIQLQWQDKMRQAEIDVSLERAKLARERTQLEQDLEDTKREKVVSTSDPSQSKKRKWLEHLGLRDESRGDS